MGNINTSNMSRTVHSLREKVGEHLFRVGRRGKGEPPIKGMAFVSRGDDNVQ